MFRVRKLLLQLGKLLALQAGIARVAQPEFVRSCQVEHRLYAFDIPSSTYVSNELVKYSNIFWFANTVAPKIAHLVSTTRDSH